MGEMLIATRKLLNLGSGKLLLVANETHKCPPAASSHSGPTPGVRLLPQREARAEAAQQQLLRVNLEGNAGNPKWTLLSAGADGAVCKQRGARFLQGGSQGSLLHPMLTQWL